MQYHKIENNVLHETVYAGEHESGLGVFVIPKKGFRKKYAIFGTRFGSIDNQFVPVGEDAPVLVPDGVAHYLEHKLFEQPDGGNAFDAFAKYGANANAFTSFTNTCYLFSCTEHFSENLTHLISFVQSPYFTEENVAKEQGIIGQEIRMYDDDPQWQVFFRLMRGLYHKNPVRIDIAGTVESIAKIDKEVLYRCYRSFYNPGNMVLCIAGDVDVADTFARIAQTVTADGPTGAVASVYPKEPESVLQSEIKTVLDVPIPLFQIGFKDNANAVGRELFKNELATKMLLKLLSGRSSALYNALYEEGLVNAEFGYDLMMEPQFACAMVGGESEHPDAVAERLLKQIDQFKKNGFSKDEIARTKHGLLGGFLRTFNDVEDIATLFCRSLLNGVDPLDFPALYQEIDSTFLQERLDTLFTRDNMAISIVSNHETTAV